MLSSHSEAVAMIAWLKKQSKAAKQGYKAIQIVKKWRRSIYFTYDCHAMTSSYEIDCKLILSLRRSVLNDAKGLKIDHMTSNRATEITAYYFFLKANDSYFRKSKQVQVLRDLITDYHFTSRAWFDLSITVSYKACRLKFFINSKRDKFRNDIGLFLAKLILIRVTEIIKYIF